MRASLLALVFQDDGLHDLRVDQMEGQHRFIAKARHRMVIAYQRRRICHLFYGETQEEREILDLFGEPAGTRTQGPRLKRGTQLARQTYTIQKLAELRTSGVY